jgi:hypothetical protein
MRFLLQVFTAVSPLFSYSPPQFASISPPLGPAGVVITLTGANFGTRCTAASD